MNKLLVILALIADVALIVNVWRHWDDNNKVVIQLSCTAQKGHINCMVGEPFK